MKLLLITQILDRKDPILGFFHSWVSEFSKQCEKVTVICLKKGGVSLPPNVEVLSLGKEKGESRIKYLCKFFWFIVSRRAEYDSVFVHMNQIYVILGFVYWKLFGKKITLWYAHGKVSLSLRVASALSHIVFTSTPSGFRLNTPKKRVVGQGIDTELLKFSGEARERGRLISVGRIDPVKDYETMIEALPLLQQEEIILSIFGPLSNQEYVWRLQNLIQEKNLRNKVFLKGSLEYEKLSEEFKASGIFLNASGTGSLDKACLDAMATGLPVITSNEAFREMFEKITPQVFFKEGDAEDLARSIRAVMSLDPEKYALLSRQMREIVEREHGLPGLVRKILGEIQK